MPKPTVASLATQLRELRGELSALRKTQRQTIQERPRDVEQLDPRRVEMPLGMQRPPTIQELVAQYVDGALSRQAQEEGFETFEEADDFEPEEEELLPLSGYEVVQMALDDPPGTQEGPDPDQAAIDAPEASQEASPPPAESSESEPPPVPDSSQ